MKNTNICPKCKNIEIIKVPGNVEDFGSGNNIKLSMFTRALVDRYICGNCGFLEEWIDCKDIEKIKKKYCK